MLVSTERLRRALISLALGAAIVSTLPAEGVAGKVTACSIIDICYCVNDAYLPAINANIARIRGIIVGQRTKGKATGYMSIPLSSVGGSYIGVNTEVAQQTKERLENRLGRQSAWILDPAAEGNLPADATGADYMYMWTKVLEGRDGLGEDFDFVYFVGPVDFSRFFSLTGDRDMKRIEEYFDKRLDSDANLKAAVVSGAVKKSEFRNYYGLRASVSFSYGSHDEWNIARILNERRRGAADFGIAKQLAILFDGNAIAPGTFEAVTTGGDTGRCIQ
jgi:hypothetical protein